MSLITGTIKVLGRISPTDTTDIYATHTDIYGQGGLHSVADATAMSAITYDRRKDGMMVYLQDTNLTYQLQGGTGDTFWTLFSGAGATTGVHNDLSGLQGGTGSQYYHLTTGEHNILTTGGTADSLHTHPQYSSSAHTHTAYTTDGEFTTHTGSSTIHFTVGSIDHGSINAASLLDNDHPQYRLTATTINFSEIGSTGHTHAVANITDFTPTDYALSGDLATTTSSLTTHTGTGGIHFTVASIDHGSIAGLADDDHPRYSQSAHTHTEYTTDAEFTTHTGTSTIHFTVGSIDHGSIAGLTDDDHKQYRHTGTTINFSEIGSTGHTHTESDITDLGDYALQTDLTAHTTSGSVHFTEASIDIANIVSAHTHDSSQLTYTNATPTEVAHGGLEIGTTFNQVSFQSLMDSILYPYQTPSFASFYISTAPSEAEVGQTILVGSYDFAWVFNNGQNVSATTLGIYDITNAGWLYQDVSTGSPQNHNFGAGIQKTSVTTHQWRGVAKNTNQVEFTSSTESISWRWARYYGSGGTTLTASEVSGLTTQLGTGFANASTGYVMEATNYKWLAYPSSWGTATEFTDKNTFLEVPMSGSFVMNVTNQYGQTVEYRLHRTLNSLGGAVTILVS